MAQELKSNSLHAFDLLREAAREYNGAEYKFYAHGFVKYVREGNRTILIDDIYIRPEFRGTPMASVMLERFEKWLKEEKYLMYYGRVWKGSDKYDKRIKTFKKWGMDVIEVNDVYTIVRGLL